MENVMVISGAALAAATLGVILQIVILTKIAGNKKQVLAALEALGTTLKPPMREPRHQGDRGHDSRYNRNQPREPRSASSSGAPQQGAQPQAAPQPESVDRTLRDINLKLKNAEQNQERARQDIQGIGQTGERSYSDRDRGGRDRGGRGGRDRGGRGGRDRGGRDGGRDRGPREGGEFRGGRDSGEIRGRSPNRSYEQQTTLPASIGAEPPVVAETRATVEPTVQEHTPVIQPIQAAPVSEVSAPSVDSQSDRRNTIKRRPVEADDQSAGASASQENTSSSEEAAQPVIFGRR